MPELPEVEVLVRHLAPLLRGRRVAATEVRRPKVIAPGTCQDFVDRLTGARCLGLQRRGKYLVFEWARPSGRFRLLGHLGMTGRMYLQSHAAPLPKHVAVTLRLDRQTFVYEDPRYFGRLTFDLSPLGRLGPEPLEPGFSTASLRNALRRSRQAIKVKLLDQALVAGVGNIYASEALFRARLSPRRLAGRLEPDELSRLRNAIRTVLREAIRWGSTVPLEWSGSNPKDKLFYYGRAADAPDYYAERLRVYDRAEQPCLRCRTPIRRIVQAARSTYFCPLCQCARSVPI